MIRLRSRRIVSWTALGFCLTAAAAAQPEVSSQAPDQVVAGNEAYGPLTQDLWVPGTKFVMKNYTNSAEEPVMSANGLVYAPGITYAFYWSPLELPIGAVVTGLVCIGDDSEPSVGANLAVHLIRHVYSFSGPALAFEDLASASTSGNPGLGVTSTASLNHTVRAIYSDVNGTHRGSYSLEATLGTQIGLFGCVVFWNRSIAPPPNAATFSDVPLTHDQSAFIEALAAAGITTGCGGGKFCPNDPVTRGQLAIFLARALGLHWSY